ncbi:MAG TPA: hypothetical protein DEQ02_09120 [Ruminococcaceae bacterium]|nr:hypothetical protein [Oscillospiraceae bacterium]
MSINNVYKSYPNDEANKSSQNIIRTILLLVFISSFFTILGAMALVAIKTNYNCSMTENMWLFFLPIPIPLSSLILGLIYKRKGYKATKNIVVGIIFTALLTIYGSFTFIFSGIFFHDYEYVNQIETQINFALPDKGQITTQDWSAGTQTGADTPTINYLYDSDIRFTDRAEIANFNESINNSELWMTSIKTSLLGEIPPLYSIYFSGTEYRYFLIYNVDLKAYNTLPEKSGTYRFIFISYDSVHNTMKIGEYTLKILI